MKISYLLLASLLSLVTACAATEEGSNPLVLSVSNVITPAATDTDYQLPFLVQLKNEDGSALANTQVEVSIQYLKYHKGSYTQLDCDGDGTDDCWAITSGVNGSLTAICPAEDSNNNGALDSGEDINGNGTMEPNNNAEIAAHPSAYPTLNTGKLITDNTGSVYFVLQYPQAETGWSQLRITASTTVGGSVSAQSYDFVLPAFAEDLLTDLNSSPPGGNELSLYGTNTSCTTP